jgi:hypothetical protein
MESGQPFELKKKKETKGTVIYESTAIPAIYIPKITLQMWFRKFPAVLSMTVKEKE